MHSYGSNNQAGRGQNYNQYQYPATQYPGQQQTYTNSSHYQPPHQYYDSQNTHYSQAPWSGQQYQTSYPQSTPSGYSPTAGHGYQNSVQQHPNSHQPNNNSRTRHSDSPTSQNCYNCGGGDHWAQNCPEPRRANPAGAMNDHRPTKRQKTNGPVVTRYPPPPNYQQQGGHRGYTHPPTGHGRGHQFNNYPNVQTPVPANPYNPKQWQQQSPVQQSPQSQQSGPTTPWAQPGAQTPASQFGSPSSTPGLGQQSSFRSNGGGPKPQGPELKRDSFDSAGNLSRPGSQISEHSNSTAALRKGNSDGPFSAVEHLEPWMEELQALDIPDIQPNSSAIIWHPPNPVGKALASTADEADAVGRLPIAATLPPGVPVSKYFQNTSSEDMKRPVEETADWQEVKFDPAFIAVEPEGPAVPVSELISHRNALMGHFDDGTEGNEDQNGQYEEAELAQPSSDAEIPSPRTKSPTDEYPTTWQDKERAPDNRLSEEERRAIEQEEKLAALGVTGPPKPVRVLPPPLKIETQHSDADTHNPPTDLSTDGDRRENIHAPQDEQHVRKTETPTPIPPPRNRKRSKEKQVYTEAQEALQGFPTEDSDGSQSTALSPSDYRAVDGVARSVDGQVEHSTTNVHVTSSEKSNGHQDPVDAFTTPDSKGKSMSPTNNRLPSSDSKKRSFRELSEESDGGQKRQFDDTRRRFKRRQPQVAEAYGRRW